MKRKLLNYLGIILIIVGITVLCVIGYRKYTTYEGQQQLKEKFQQILKEKEPIKSSNESEKEKTDSVNGIIPIALVKIPKIDVEVAVGEGTGEDVLKYALGHFKDTAMPGEKGNFAVAGHRNFTYAEYFKDLDKLTKGDEIIVKTKSGEYTYLVDSSFIVNPDKVEILEPTKEKTITLVTCTFGAKQRLIIKGILKK